MMKSLLYAAVVFIFSAASHAVAASAYEDDWKAFAEEVDKTYPFFKLKGIEEDWKEAKKELGKKAERARNDREFLTVIDEACRCLRDGHMTIRPSKKDVIQYPEEWCLPVSFMPGEKDQVVIMSSSLKGNASKLRPGMVVMSIDGVPARKALDQKAEKMWKEGGYFSSPQRAALFAYRQPLSSTEQSEYVLKVTDGTKQSTVKLKNDRPARGWTHTYHMPDDLKPINNGDGFTKLDSGAGYIYLRRINEQSAKTILSALDAFPETKGWIIDIRGNSGGGYGEELIEAFKRIPQPVAVIIDAGCISAGETVARDLKNICKARLFGATTAGSSSSKKQWEFPSGIATVRISTRSRKGIDGQLIEFNGIKPDVEVEANPNDVLNGKNTEILAAEKYLSDR